MKQKAANRLIKFVDVLPIPPILQPKLRNADHTYYEVRMLQTRLKLHRDLPPTEVWGYEGMYPGPTIEVEAYEKVLVKWINDLPAKHLLPVDFTVHGAHKDVPEVRTVAHLHGAVVEPDSDGYPEAWFTKNFAQTGPYFVHKVYRYANPMAATTLWYHDHALGITRLNVYAGLAGLYLIRDSHERSLGLPSGPYDVPLVIQDKSFYEDGSLYYPTQPEHPVPELKVSVVPEFFADTNLVNGKVWPRFEVEPRKYRFRLLNAANARFYRLSLDSGQAMTLVATDGGLVEQPIELKELLLSPAERVDIVIDFSRMEGQRIMLSNSAPAPYPQGPLPDPGTTGVVMAFDVTLPLKQPDESVIPAFMRLMPRWSPSSVSRHRALSLDSTTDWLGRHLMLLDNKRWDDPITESPQWGTTEIWSFINITEDTHPIHLHLGFFFIIGRRPFDPEAYKKDGTIRFTGPHRPPEPEERGWKDVANAHPNEVTSIVKRFDSYLGRYVWHCHMLEHEDYEMMRPFIVIVGGNRV